LTVHLNGLSAAGLDKIEIDVHGPGNTHLDGVAHIGRNG
jgi:hypothetical protein